MPPGTCVHTPADCSSSWACWGPRALPYVLASKTSSGLSIQRVFSMHRSLPRSFYASLPPEGMKGHMLIMQRVMMYTTSSPVDPVSHSRSVLSVEMISMSCSLRVTPPSNESATLPTLPVHNPIFHIQPVNLNSDVPCSCAWLPPAAGPEGEGGFPAYRNLP